MHLLTYIQPELLSETSSKPLPPNRFHKAPSYLKLLYYVWQVTRGASTSFKVKQSNNFSRKEC